MAPLDIATGEGPACSANMVSPRCRPIRCPSDEDPAVSSPQPASVQKAENSNNNHNLQDAGERRRTRALKLRQTRTRNAARAQIYCTSAEDSEDEEDEDVKPDIEMLRGEAPLDCADKQTWKKQQRMIRNRESAALSRKRKRDRIESLEQQVARLMDDNRGLRHRLAKYEASPQQARYKYARQTAAVKPGPALAAAVVEMDRGGRNNCGSNGGCDGENVPMKAGRKRVLQRAALEGLKRHGNGNSNGKPVSCLNSRESAVETAAHGLSATINNADGRRTSLRTLGRRATRANPSSSSPSPSLSCLSSCAAPHEPSQCPPACSAVISTSGQVSPLPSKQQQQQQDHAHLSSSYPDYITPASSSTTRTATTSPPSTELPPATTTAPALPPIAAVTATAAAALSSIVKMEISSDSDEGETSGAPVTIDGYSSSSTFDDSSSSSSSLSDQYQYQQAIVGFDENDEAACDDLLLDIFSEDGGVHAGHDDESFLSLLASDLIGRLSSQPSAPESMDSLNNFVKQEIGF